MTSLPPSDPYPIRAISPDEYALFDLVAQHAFHVGPASDVRRELAIKLFDFSRSLAAFDGSTIAGTALAFSFEVSVPGGSLLPGAGVTYVSVLPSHRRRGVLRSLMRRQLQDIESAAREPIALLWASEAGIYSRYGYGRASWQLSLTLRRGEGAFASPGSGSGSGSAPGSGLAVSLVSPPEVLEALALVYDQALPTRPGLWARSPGWWERRIADPPESRGAAGPLRCVLVSDNSGPRGYALYAGTQGMERETALPDSSLTVRELVVVDAAASAALWGNLLSRDLTTEFRIPMRPVDDPVLYQLADPRRARAVLSDALWVRLVDVGAALSARRYSAQVDVVISVRDRDLPRNVGRWRLATVPEGAGGLGSGLAASCSRTDDEADLELDVGALGAAYLGGTRLAALAGAGLVTELRPGAVRALTAAMAWDPAPWCPMVF
jgi:predicted acetyltransferase